MIIKDKILCNSLTVFLVLLISCTSSASSGAAQDAVSDTDSVIGTTEIPDGVRYLMSAYPDWVIGYRNDSVILSDSSMVIYDDTIQKSFVGMLDNPDLEDMFSLQYSTDSVPGYLQDAGRGRNDLLFKFMYGNSAAAVQKNLTTVDWFGQKIRVTKINSVNEKLAAVAEELGNHPELKSYYSCSGTFYWRAVRGVNRLSAHSYGIAIDIAVAYSGYWRWKYPNKSEMDHIAYDNKIPLIIVEAFEKHGFIWGGRWYHYDTMHFEYRPEILLQAQDKK